MLEPSDRERTGCHPQEAPASSTDVVVGDAVTGESRRARAAAHDGGQTVQAGRLRPATIGKVRQAAKSTFRRLNAPKILPAV
jgi:hypothetical protein